MNFLLENKIPSKTRCSAIVPLGLYLEYEKFSKKRQLIVHYFDIIFNISRNQMQSRLINLKHLKKRTVHVKNHFIIYTLPLLFFYPTPHSLHSFYSLSRILYNDGQTTHILTFDGNNFFLDFLTLWLHFSNKNINHGIF